MPSGRVVEMWDATGHVSSIDGKGAPPWEQRFLCDSTVIDLHPGFRVYWNIKIIAWLVGNRAYSANILCEPKTVQDPL